MYQTKIIERVEESVKEYLSNHDLKDREKIAPGFLMRSSREILNIIISKYEEECLDDYIGFGTVLEMLSAISCFVEIQLKCIDKNVLDTMSDGVLH